MAEHIAATPQPWQFPGATTIHEFGWNDAMDAIQQPCCECKLTHIVEWNRSRQKHAATYDQPVWPRPG